MEEYFREENYISEMQFVALIRQATDLGIRDLAKNPFGYR